MIQYKPFHRLYLFISGFLNILDGLIKILTLGFYVTSFSFKFMIKWHEWIMTLKMKKKIK